MINKLKVPIFAFIVALVVFRLPIFPDIESYDCSTPADIAAGIVCDGVRDTKSSIGWPAAIILSLVIALMILLITLAINKFKSKKS